MAYYRLTERRLCRGAKMMCPLCEEGPFYIGLDSIKLGIKGSMWTHWRDHHDLLYFENHLDVSFILSNKCCFCGERMWPETDRDAYLSEQLNRKRYACVFMYHMCGLKPDALKSHMVRLLLSDEPCGLLA